MRTKHLAETMDGYSVNWMIEQAKKNKINIAGSLVIKESDEFFNRLIVASPEGQIQYYDKKHLFSYADENLNYSPGKQELIIPINGVKIAFFICYDLRFPIWSRNIKLKYDVAVYIANWPEKRKEHWITLLKARAIENQSYVIGVNRIGDDGNGINYSGESGVYNYLGQKISTTKPYEFSVENVILDLSALKNYRIKFPAHLDADKFHLD
jgi:predicted amidohydrolase